MNQIEDLPVRVPRACRQTRALTSVTTGLWAPGRKTRRTITVMITSFVILITVVGSIAQVLPGIVSAFAQPASSSFSPNTGCTPNPSNSTLSPDCVGTPPSTATSSPNVAAYIAGAAPVPDLSLPHTILTSLDNIVHAGGVIRTSPENLTLYNSAVILRLLGGMLPHDELLSPNKGSLSSYFFWNVQASMSSGWIPLLPSKSNFTILGTNTTGTFVARTMRVQGSNYDGTFTIIYRATSAGPLKWDLEFDPAVTGQYRLVYSWLNVTGSHNSPSDSRQFQVRYADANYTFNWEDVPPSLNTTASIIGNSFVFSINLGTIAAGSTSEIDPSVAGSSPYPSATAFTFQRKVLYDSVGGRYWVFYGADCGGYICGLQYSSSNDGIQWSSPSSAPDGGCCLVGDPSQWIHSVYASGTAVVISWNQRACGAIYCVKYVVGNITGSQINWGTTWTLNVGNYSCQTFGGQCTWGARYVYTTATSTGKLAFSFNTFTNVTASIGMCPTNGYTYTESDEKLVYVNSANPDTVTVGPVVLKKNILCVPLGQSGVDKSDQDRSILLPSDSQDGVRVTYQSCAGCSVNPSIHSQLVNYQGNTGPDETVAASVPNTDEFSAINDANYGTHLVYRTSDGKVSYAYRAASASAWTPPSPDIFGGTVSYPTITVDYSTNDIYALGIATGSTGSSIIMKTKSLSQGWGDVSSVYPITARTGAVYLTSNAISASYTSASQILIIWTEGTNPYNVMFASIPIQTVWSPYAVPSDPWDNSGIAPYGQYFANLGESVSPATGTLTVLQTDLSVPGRGIDLSITRVYTEPYSFLGNNPYLYEQYPWTPMGDAWQLNFPWMNSVNTPLYIHLWNGEAYRIPSSFWTGPGSWENHQGDNFRLVHNADNTVGLYAATGESFTFDASHKLTAITDSTLNNTISFNYANNMISCISDTAQRAYTFSYSGGLLSSLQQVNGTCLSPGTTIRRILYANDGQSLISVTDPGNRATNYTYQPSSGAVAPWLLTRITYPTGSYSNYTYGAWATGTTANSYRVSKQYVGSPSNLRTRESDFKYTNGAGDRVNNSTVVSYNGTATQPVTFTTYSFSFAGMTMNVSDANHQLVRGLQQRFGVNGEIPREIVLVSDGQGRVRSYSNYYRYDLWGNRIYSRRVINPSANWYHESFNAYYNNGLPPGFYAFQETFSQNQGTTPDNPWSVNNGYWMVQNGAYNGTETNNGDMESMVSYADIGKSDLSLQARVFIKRQINNTSGTRVGIFAHYMKTGPKYYKWALIFDQGSLQLVDAWTAFVASVPCTLNYNVWYTLNMTIHGFQVTGWASAPGQTCPTVSGTYSTSSPAASGTAFGLYAGGYSALFDNVTVATISPMITGTGFSNSFIASGSPGPNIHTALAGTAELQNGTATLPIESYFSYYPWGGLNQQKNRYDRPLITPDGSAQGFCSNYTSSCTATLSTFHPNDIIIVFASKTLDRYGWPCSFAVSDTAGLSWANRTGIIFGRFKQDQIQEFWARSPSMLSSDVINESISGCSTEYNGLQVFGISGANYNSPFDPNTGVPGTGSGNSAGTSVTISTSNPNDMVFGYVQHGNFPVPTPQFGFNTIISIGQHTAEYQDFGGTLLTNFAVTFGDSVSDYWQEIADAVQPATASYATQWLTSGRLYDGVYGNPKKYTDFMGNVTLYDFSSTYKNAYLTNQTLILAGTPSTSVTTLYSYNFTTGNVLSVTDPMSNVTNYQNDKLGRTTGVTYPVATSQPGLDGSAQGFCSNTTSSCSVTFSTSHSNDIIIVFASETLDLQSSCSFAVSDTTGLSWTNRTRVVFGRGNRDQLQEFWARSTGLLSSDTITESISGCGNSYNGLQVFAISGANFNSPFDPNTGVPGTWSGNSAGTSVTISTSNPNDIVFADVQHGSLPVPTVQSGFNTIISIAGHAAEYQVENTTLTNFSVTFGDSVSDYWQEIADAVQPTRDFVSYSYNDAGNYLDVTNENYWKTHQIYDGLGRLTVVERFSSGLAYSNETTTYDGLNRVMVQTDPVGNAYRYQYDAIGRVTRVTKPDGNFTQQFYNDIASWIRYTDEYGNYRCNIYDRLGRLISVVEEADSQCQSGIVTNYYYNEVGDLVGVTNANQQSTVYSYDNLNRLTQTSYPDGTVELFSYDNSGNIIAKIDRNNVKTIYSYDSLNRVTTTTFCGTPITSTGYTYDKNSNLLQLRNQNATITYAYDARNRPLSEKYQVNAASRQVIDLGCSGTGSTSTTTGGTSLTYTASYTYNGEVLSTITYPTIVATNIAVNYGYDGLGRVSNITKSGSNTYYAKSFTYYKNDAVRGLQFGNGLVENYTYDSLSRPSSMTLKNGGTIILSLTYAYNKTGTVASVRGSITQVPVNEQYKYDPLQRLTNANVTSQGTTNNLWYSYDNLGNRQQQILNGTTTNYSYSYFANNELTSSATYSASALSASYTYDRNGNLATKSVTTSGTITWAYTWDAANHLLKVSSNGVTQGAYAYDGRGRQVEGVESSSTTFYAYLGTEVLFRNVYNQFGVDYLYAGGMRIATVDNSSGSYNTVKYFHEDALGSTRLVTSSSGVVTFADSYQPFGQDNGTPTGSETFKFTGKPVSQTTGLYYDYQRWYDPTIGRFISQDPQAGYLSDPQSLNAYIYVQDTPTSLTDPSGLVGGPPGVPPGNCREGCPTLLDTAAKGWNSLPDWAKAAIIITVVAVAIVVTVGIAAPELLPAIPFLLAGDIGIFGGGGGGGPCEEDPEACAPPPPPLSGDDVNPPPPPTDIVDISRGGFEEARAAGVYGNQPIQLAEGNYAHSVLTPGLADQGFNTQEALTPGNFPDAWNENAFVEIKPYHEGVNPFREYGSQFGKYTQAFIDRFGYPPNVRLILYRYI